MSNYFINVNDRVKIKLTEIGEKAYLESVEHLKEYGYEPKLPEKDKNGYIEMQLWDVMARFGHLCGCGFDIPFMTPMIIRGKDLEEVK